MKQIIFSLAVIVGGGMLSTAQADNITDLKDLSNSAVYTISRMATNTTSGSGIMQAVENENVLYTLASGRTDKESPLTQWSLHYSASEKSYFLYNLGTKQFVTGNGKHEAVLTDAAVDCHPIFDEGVSYWMLDCGGYFIGLSDDHEGAVLFADGLSKAGARALGCYFTVATLDGKTLSADEVAAIDAKIADGRKARIDEYRDFIENTAKKVGTAGGTGAYIGEYDYEALEYALNNESKYTLAQIEELYQQTLQSRYPVAGRYYRLHNFTRPAAHARNHVSTLEDGTLVSRPIDNPAFGTAGAEYSDDLCLVRFYPVDGDRSRVKLQIPSFLQYLTGAGNNQRPGLTSSFSDAYVFDLTPVTDRSRYFRLHEGDKDAWLTVSNPPAGKEYGFVNGYSTPENPNRWFIEEVNSITVPVDANGYATVCLPCGVSLPEGVKAYTVTDFSGGKAYVEEIASPIHLSTPWILKAEAGAGSVELPLQNNQNYVYSSMVGNMRAASDVPGRYVPTFSADGISFVYAPAAERALPGSCYIVSDDLGAITTVMGANPDAGIEEITVDAAAGADLYDMLGRPVKKGNLVPGVYINAGTRKAVRVK